MIIIVSACLLGDNVTYRGDSNNNKEIKELIKGHTIIKVCPEVTGGLPIPRKPSEILSLQPLKVINNQNKDVTTFFYNGSIKSLELCKHADMAILKANSPSCGNESIYDGSFSHTLIKGQGVFVSMLKNKNIKVFNEHQIDEIKDYIEYKRR
jgi:uncharacterized protein YbbK (DUF523 family)